MSYLKSKVVTIDGVGEIEIRELPAIAQIEMMEAKETPFEGLFVACRHGAFPDKSVDEIKRMLTMKMANDIAAAVFELSGVDIKN